MYKKDMKLNTKNFNEVLLEYIPEFLFLFEERSDISDNGDNKHMVIVAFCDFIENTTKDDEKKVFSKISDFIELWSYSEDERINDVLITGLFEFIEDNPIYEKLLKSHSKEAYNKFKKLSYY